MSDWPENDLDNLEGDVRTLERARTQTPKRYAVIIHNDDYTTQEFVVHVLIKFFYYDPQAAMALMLQVHTKGKAKVGMYTKDVAESKIAVVTQHARQEGMPLLLTLEVEG